MLIRKTDTASSTAMITALSSFYKVSFMIDVVNGVTQVIKNSDEFKKYYPDGMIPHKVFLETFSNEMVEKEYTQAVREFMDLDTMEQRMKDADVEKHMPFRLLLMSLRKFAEKAEAARTFIFHIICDWQ